MSHKLGKGVLYLSIANFFFFAASYIIYFALARVLPQEQFGVYGVVIALASVVNIIFVDGLQQAVSKFISQNPEIAHSIRKKTSFFLIAVGLAFFAIFFFLSDFIALFFNDPELAPYIQIIGLLFISHPLYAVFTGFFNGLKDFKTQAKLKTAYSLMKASFILALAFMTGSVFGAIAGFIAASFAAFLLGMFLARGRAKAGGNFDLKKLLKFAAPLSLFALSITVLLSMDLFAVKILSLRELSNIETAYYTAATTISRLPFFATIAFGMVLFPTISAFSQRKEIERIRSHVSQASRYAFMILAPLVFLVAATSGQLITFLYPEIYSPGAQPLFILVFALGFYSLFYMFSAVVSGYGKPVIPMAIALAALAISFFANLFLVPAYGLNGAATASLISMLFAFIAISIAVGFLFKVFIPLKSIPTILLAAFISSFAIRQLILPGIFLPIIYLIALSMYVGLLFIFRELKQKDIDFLKGIIFRRKALG